MSESQYSAAMNPPLTFGDEIPTFLILRKRDAEPWEVYPFTNDVDAMNAYDGLQQQWSECYLLRVQMRGQYNVVHPVHDNALDGDNTESISPLEEARRVIEHCTDGRGKLYTEGLLRSISKIIVQRNKLANRGLWLRNIVTGRLR